MKHLEPASSELFFFLNSCTIPRGIVNRLLLISRKVSVKTQCLPLEDCGAAKIA